MSARPVSPQDTSRVGEPTSVEVPEDPRGKLPSPIALPLLWVAVLYLIATGRWGSYVGIPGLPFYAGDILLVLAVAQVVVLLRRRGTSLRDVGRALVRADVALLLCLSLLSWVTIRGALSISAVLDDPLLGLRDAAPYAYAVVALLAFLLPAGGGARQRRLVYIVLTVHAAWVLLGQRLPNRLVDGLLLGGSPIFTARPDFDSAIAGLAIAFSLYDLLLGRRPRSIWPVTAIVCLAAANAVIIGSLQTRAGLLAGVVNVGVVLLIWAIRSGAEHQGVTSRRRRLAVLLASLAVLGAVVAMSPPGQRLMQAVTGEESQALGTVQVREYAWTGVTDYIFSDARRTAIGVGFGPDFIQDAGVAYALEGTEYNDVRSPHNYVLGTMARLGLAGALLAVLTMVSGAALAVRRLSGQADSVTVLAGLLVVGIPIIALLGVVLESPFGAIPYFWAIGHLARSSGGSDGE